MDQAEASGRTVDDAFKAALAQLNASPDEVEMVILDEGHKANVFGRGSRDARVRVERVAVDTDSPAAAEPSEEPVAEEGRPRTPRARTPRPTTRRAPERRSHLEEAVPRLTEDDFLRSPGSPGAAAQPRAAAPAPRASAPRAAGERRAPRPSSGPPRERERERRPRREADVPADINAEEVELAAQALDDILRILDIDAEITIREPLTAGEGLGTSRAVIDVNGADLGVLIGRRGDTLASLQHVLNLIVSKRIPDAAGVTVDVEHYRHRREEQLGALALRMADRVRRTGSPITLEPMPASDRRLIHLTLADDPDVQTYSIGEGDARKVVLAARD